MDYLEAHGAGSELGDPIEVQAAAAVYGKERDVDQPLLMGSVKTNIGHLESAAGVAALIKAVLAMRHGRIPKNLHFRDPNPHLDWDHLPVRVVSETVAWPSTPDRPPRAGVSAFGISGTNAHVIVEGYGSPNGASPSPLGLPQPVAVSALPQPDTGLAARGTRLLPLSGKSAASLRKLAERYLAWLDEREPVLKPDEAASGEILSDMAWTAGTGRSHFGHRAAVAFEDCRSLREGLHSLAAANESEPVTPARIAFAYASDGIHWIPTCEALHASEPAVRSILDRCDEVFGEVRNASLLDVMFARRDSVENLDDPQWARPATYALQCAITALWSGVGVQPGVALGHGVGVLAAAQAANVFGLEDGLRLAMAFDHPGAIPDDIAMGAPSLTLLDTLTGLAVSPDDVRDAAYWRRQVAGEPESIQHCAGTLASAGIGMVIELGPNGALGTMLAETEGTPGPVILSSFGRSSNRGGAAQSRANGSFANAVAGAWEAGLAISFAGLFAGESRRRVSLPDYPFERRRHWI